MIEHLRKTVRVYWNLHKKCWSVKSMDPDCPDRGRVIAHASHVVLHGVTFTVSEAGRQRVIKERRKNVHAYAQGTLQSITRVRDLEPSTKARGCIEAANIRAFGTSVRYDPYLHPKFHTVDPHSGERFDCNSAEHAALDVVAGRAAVHVAGANRGLYTSKEDPSWIK